MSNPYWKKAVDLNVLFLNRPPQIRFSGSEVIYQFDGEYYRRFDGQFLWGSRIRFTTPPNKNGE